MATVRIEAVYPDGSGAPATVEIGAHLYAADYLGKPTLRLISRRMPARWVAAAAARAYVGALNEAIVATPEWFAANSIMYAEVA